MAIRHWHPLKLGIIWLIDLALFLALWLLVSPYRGDDQALVIVVWIVLSIPIFTITWKWASGRQTILKFADEGRPNAPQMGTSNKSQGSKVSGFLQAALLFVVGACGAVGGYWYKHFQAQTIGDVWIEVKNKPDNLAVGFGKKGDRFLFDGTLLVPSIDTRVKFKRHQTNQTEDVVLGYLVSLEIVGENPLNVPDSISNNVKVIPLTECGLHLVFTLFDKDGFEIAQLEGRDHTLRLGSKELFQDLTEKGISLASAIRTVSVKQKIIGGICRYGLKS